MKKVVLLLALFAGALPSLAFAQKTTLTISGFPLNFTTPTASDFIAGQITAASATTFTVNATTGTSAQRTTTVWVRCGTPCPSAGTKPGSTLFWRRADLSTWNALTTTFAQIETRTVFQGQPLPASNDPWSNSLYWQFSLSWTGDPPSATANAYNIIFQLTVTVP